MIYLFRVYQIQLGRTPQDRIKILKLFNLCMNRDTFEKALIDILNKTKTQNNQQCVIIDKDVAQTDINTVGGICSNT